MLKSDIEQCERAWPSPSLFGIEFLLAHCLCLQIIKGVGRKRIEGTQIGLDFALGFHTQII